MHLAAADGDIRLLVIRNAKNTGPAKSRNIAIDRSTAPFIAILDGDDIFLPNRFSNIFRETDWDFCADNIVFYSDQAQLNDMVSANSVCHEPARQLTLSAFISGNVPVRGKPRGELGFLKPVMRRKFLEAKGLRYAEDCRLGEDFLFYSQALAHGARYTVTLQCGYAALVRANSLSGQHSVNDLSALYTHECKMLRQLPLSVIERQWMKRRVVSTRRRLHHRQVLAAKAQHGLISGLFTGVFKPTAFLDIGKDYLKKTFPAATCPALPRRLLCKASYASLEA